MYKIKKNGNPDSKEYFNKKRDWRKQMKKILNFMKNPKIKMIGILSILLFFYTTVCAISYAQSVSSDIADSVFRLHVIANSDSDEDQKLKLKVRDELLKTMNSLCENANSKEEAMNIAKENSSLFQSIAEKTIQDNGYNYSVTIHIGQYDFPTKTYGDIALPAGNYDALRVEIGEAKGKNWWCVMFPPLCFIDVTSGVVPNESKEQLEDSMSEEDYALISDKNNSGIEFKFKILEFFAQNGFLTAKN